MGCGCSMSDFAAQKFGRPQIPNGTGQAEKALNGFAHTVYYPTNWRDSWEPLESKIPNLFLRYGGTTVVAPEYYQRGYIGAFPIKQQPTIDTPQPFTQPRYS